jgi:hypothetical protein
MDRGRAGIAGLLRFRLPPGLKSHQPISRIIIQFNNLRKTVTQFCCAAAIKV